MLKNIETLKNISILFLKMSEILKNVPNFEKCPKFWKMYRSLKNYPNFDKSPKFWDKCGIYKFWKQKYLKFQPMSQIKRKSKIKKKLLHFQQILSKKYRKKRKNGKILLFFDTYKIYFLKNITFLGDLKEK